MKSKMVLLFYNVCESANSKSACWTFFFLALSSFITDPQRQYLAAAYQSVHRLNSLNVALSKYLFSVALTFGNNLSHWTYYY